MSEDPKAYDDHLPTSSRTPHPYHVQQQQQQMRTVMEGLRQQIRFLGKMRQQSRSPLLTQAFLRAQNRVNQAHCELYDALEIFEHEAGHR